MMASEGPWDTYEDGEAARQGHAIGLMTAWMDTPPEIREAFERHLAESGYPSVLEMFDKIAEHVAEGGDVIVNKGGREVARITSTVLEDGSVVVEWGGLDK